MGTQSTRLTSTRLWSRRAVWGVLMLPMAFAAGAQEKSNAKFPSIVKVRVTERTAGKFDFDVTVSSPYDTPQRYADAIRVTAPSGAVLGERLLDHDHASEQPFTRTVSGVTVPVGIKMIVVQGRDQKNGYGGKSLEVAIPGR